MTSVPEFGKAAGLDPKMEAERTRCSFHAPTSGNGAGKFALFSHADAQWAPANCREPNLLAIHSLSVFPMMMTNTTTTCPATAARAKRTALASAITLFLTASLLSLSACAQTPSATSPEPPLGTYHWPNGTAGIDAFATWLGRDAVWGLDFVGGESWDNVGWPTWWLDTWSKWVQAKPGRRLILSIPLLAGPVDGSGPTQGSKGVRAPVSLEQGAAGAYNPYFKDLAENLARTGLGDTILRLGWEFNGDWYTWRAKGKTAAFAEYFRQIVQTMRTVPGTEKLRFCWNPTLGDQQFPAEEAWPGDAFVDFVGLDVYDETWNADTYPWPADATAGEIERRQRKVWDEWIVNSPRGLVFWTKFAAAHHKPLAVPEWGLVSAAHGHGGKDNPHFIKQMHTFLTDPANGIAFHCYFDINESDHRHQLSPGVAGTGKQEGTEFPNSATLFRNLFGKK